MDRAADQPLDLFSTLLMTLVCAIWGGAFVAIKISLMDMPPLGSAAVRFFLTTVALLLWARLQTASLLYPWPETRVLLILTGLFFSFNLLLYLGAARTASGRATVFFYSQPVFLAVLAHYFLPNDSLTLRKGCGLIFALSGLTVLFLTKMQVGHAPTLLGDLLVLSGALANAIYNIITKRAGGRIHPVAVILWNSLGAALLLAICSWGFEHSASFIFSTRAIASLLYLSLISAAFGFVSFIWLIQHNSATRVTALVFLAPVFGVLFSWLLLHETLTGLQLLGVVGVCTGVYVVNSNGSSRDQVALPKEAPIRG
jgi:drug/metabolite transporter (DMT)-like permease